MFIVHLLLVLSSAFYVYAAETDCNHFFALKAGAELDLTNLDKLSDLLDLSPSERDHVRSYATFFTEALQARAQNRPLESLRSPYLAEQSRRLQTLVQGYIEHWSGFQNEIQNSLDRRIVRQQKAIDGLEEALRSGKSNELIEQEKQKIIGLLNRVNQKYHGEDADLETFSFAIESLSANPERKLFELKQSFGKFKDRVAADKAVAQSNSDRALVMLKQIAAKLADDGEAIDYQTLVQLELTVAVIDEAGDGSFYRLPTREDANEITFASSYGITFDGLEQTDFHEVIELWSQRFNQFGVLYLPMIGTLSQRESLAIAFLPIQPLRFQQEETWVSDFENEPHRGHTVTLADMGGGGQTGYKTSAFADQDLKGWIAALNASFNNWYLLLGGNLDPLVTVTKQLKPGDEALVRALLYYARYLPDFEHDEIDWTSAGPLANFFFTDFATWDEKHIFNPNLLTFFSGKAPTFFAELEVEKGIGEPQIIEAVDQLINRLLRSPDYKVSDANLRRLFERFPTTSFAAKMLVLKAVYGEPKEQGRGGSGYRDVY